MVVERNPVPCKKKSNSTGPGLLDRRCFYCGGRFPHEKSCPAKGKQCELCQKYNHFSKFCRSKIQFESKFKKKNNKLQKCQAERQSSSKDSTNTSSDELFLLDITSSEKVVKPNTKILLNNTKIRMTVNTGASINVIDKDTFSLL